MTPQSISSLNYTALTQATHALVSDLNIANGVYWVVKDAVFCQLPSLAVRQTQ